MGRKKHNRNKFNHAGAPITTAPASSALPTTNPNPSDGQQAQVLSSASSSFSPSSSSALLPIPNPNPRDGEQADLPLRLTAPSSASSSFAPSSSSSSSALLPIPNPNPRDGEQADLPLRLTAPSSSFSAPTDALISPASPTGNCPISGSDWLRYTRQEQDDKVIYLIQKAFDEALTELVSIGFNEPQILHAFAMDGKYHGTLPDIVSNIVANISKTLRDDSLLPLTSSSIPNLLSERYTKTLTHMIKVLSKFHVQRRTRAEFTWRLYRSRLNMVTAINIEITPSFALAASLTSILKISDAGAGEKERRERVLSSHQAESTNKGKQALEGGKRLTEIKASLKKPAELVSRINVDVWKVSRESEEIQKRINDYKPRASASDKGHKATRELAKWESKEKQLDKQREKLQEDCAKARRMVTQLEQQFTEVSNETEVHEERRAKVAAAASLKIRDEVLQLQDTITTLEARLLRLE